MRFDTGNEKGVVIGIAAHLRIGPLRDKYCDQPVSDLNVSIRLCISPASTCFPFTFFHRTRVFVQQLHSYYKADVIVACVTHCEQQSGAD